MNSWIYQERHAGKNGSCRLEADKEGPSEKKLCCWVQQQDVSWVPETQGRRVGRVSKGKSVQKTQSQKQEHAYSFKRRSKIRGKSLE